MAAILGLAIPSHGALKGRVLTEAFPGAPPVHSTRTEQSSIRDANGHATALRAWEVGTFRYLDAAGYPG
ncbi:hypothetical protein ACSTLC_24185, partial [Vibrio parahaemolyticus]